MQYNTFKLHLCMMLRLSTQLLVFLKLYLENGDEENASELLDESRLLFPGNVDILHALGEHEYYLNNMDEALYWFKEVIEIDGRDVAALRNIGVIHQDQGEPHLASMYYDQALKISPDFLALVNRSTLRYDFGMFAKAEEDLIEASKLSDDDYILYVYLASTLDSLDGRDAEVKANFDKAIELGEASLKEFPDDVYALVYVGGAYIETGNCDRGMELLRKSESLSFFPMNLLDVREDLYDVCRTDGPSP